MTQVGKVDILNDEIEAQNTALKTPLNPVEAGAAIVIARKAAKLRGIGESIVLAFLGLDHVTPYVTWSEFTDAETGRVHYETGHYFYDGEISDATADFDRRN